MNKIDERIQWYEQNATNRYDDLVRIELKKISDLYDVYEDSTDEMFVNEMIEAFCKIIETQRERISALESENNEEKINSADVYEADVPFSGRPFGQKFMSFTNISVGNGISQQGFQNDKQLQEAFTLYCLNNGKSSYTVNDYCSRIKNLWKSFYTEYIQGELPKELEINEEKINQNSPLLNALYHTEELNCYISMKIAESEGNRNWPNTRAAFNKFDKFKACCYGANI